jgi:hypothetical protein
MAKTILICGRTGTGKTTSIRTLNPKETVILRVINRTLPFKFNGMYSKELKNLFSTPTYESVINAVKWANTQEQVKNIVITDGTYIIRQEYFKRANQTGYSKYTDFAMHMQQILKAIQDCRDDIKVFMEYHVESVITDSGATEYKPSTVGKLLDSQYNILENVDIVLFALPQYEDKKINYGFVTNRTLDRNGAEIPAKSPMGMFEQEFIPNDLALVAKAVDDYYGS